MAPGKMRYGFRCTGSERRFRGAVISVDELSIEGPEGERLTREVVRHPGAVAAVALLEGPGPLKVLLVRQFRSAAGEYLLELPAGKRDVKGEPPRETMRRELIEEIGMNPSELVELATFWTTPGFTDERCTVFLASGLQECGTDRQGAEERYMEVVEVLMDDLAGLIASGELADAKSIAGLCLAQAALAQGSQPALPK
ncbi:MAG: NUDIX hydrolase [Actinobacteria bacterium]|nr:NUDIX hydrolase [Actinomycetota bacterium]